VSSTKRFFGHTLGAAGAIEAIVCVQALLHQQVPANLGLSRLDPCVPFEPVRQTTAHALARTVTNSVGFGGNNCALVISGAETRAASTRGAPTATRPRAMDVLGVGMVLPADAPVPQALPPGASAREVPVLQCSIRALETDLPRGQLRWLGKSQVMALVAAERALAAAGTDAPADGAAVCVGTGLGTTGLTEAFLRDLLSGNGRPPRPTAFSNSVHNAIAAQIAIQFNCRGENHTFSHDSLSFESALQRAQATLAGGQAPRVLACGLDEVNPCVTAVQHARGQLPEGAAPGEGAAAFWLAPSASSDAAQRLARIAAIHTMLDGGSVEEGRGPRGRLDRELDFFKQVLAAAALRWSDLDVVLIGANGDPRLDDCFRRVLDEADRRCGHAPLRATFKHRCGEICTAASIGIALAVRSVQAGRAVDPLIVSNPPTTMPPVERTLVYCRQPPHCGSATVVVR
jgi:3-oxoacyl-(acyl-carrier-protein) synthase